MTILNKNSEITDKTVATIGFFDGVHLGHRYLLDDLKSESERRGCKTLVVTFSNHPLLLFKPDCGLKFLTNCDEKLRLLEKEGIDYCLVLPFTRELASLKSSDFIALLHEKYGVKCLVVGYDHHFGSDREADFEDYVRHGKLAGVDVVRCEAFRVSDVNVSSSMIREALKFREIEIANLLLGYNYRVSGVVVHGHEVGRTIGFPTANLQIEDDKLMPGCGVYYALTEIEGKEYRAMMNIGYRPTLKNGDISYEVYIDGYSGDLYGKELRLELRLFLREERNFGSLEVLRRQLEADLQLIRVIE